MNFYQMNYVEVEINRVTCALHFGIVHVKEKLFPHFKFFPFFVTQSVLLSCSY